MYQLGILSPYNHIRTITHSVQAITKRPLTQGYPGEIMAWWGGGTGARSRIHPGEITTNQGEGEGSLLGSLLRWYPWSQRRLQPHSCFSDQSLVLTPFISWQGGTVLITGIVQKLFRTRAPHWLKTLSVYRRSRRAMRSHHAPGWQNVTVDTADQGGSLRADAVGTKGAKGPSAALLKALDLIWGCATATVSEVTALFNKTIWF